VTCDVPVSRESSNGEDSIERRSSEVRLLATDYQRSTEAHPAGVREKNETQMVRVRAIVHAEIAEPVRASSTTLRPYSKPRPSSNAQRKCEIDEMPNRSCRGQRKPAEWFTLRYAGPEQDRSADVEHVVGVTRKTKAP
jgi:hypothetical protein